MHVLFVGNSYTFYNDVPAQVAGLAREAGVSVYSETIAEGGASFEHHATSTGAVARIAGGGLDAVVLQDQSGGALYRRARFERYGKELAGRVIASGARLVWFATWARAHGHDAYRAKWSRGSPPAMTRALRAGYDELAASVGGVVAPVGDAWQLAIDAGLPFSLHDVDGHHASAAGSHLAALVLAAVVAGTDPRAARFTPVELRADVAQPLRSAAAAALATVTRS